MMEKIKNYMNKPYTKGDYFGGIGIALGIYAILGAAYLVYLKVDDMRTRRMIKENTNEDEEA